MTAPAAASGDARSNAAAKPVVVPGVKDAALTTVKPLETKPVENKPAVVPNHPVHAPEAKLPPVAPKAPEAHNVHNDMARLPPSAPKPPVAAPPKPPVAAAPRPAVAVAAPKPAMPAPKPQSCTPNMVNGKMMGMTCH